MVLDIAIIAVGVLVFVVPPLVSSLRRPRPAPSAEERRLLDGERQRLVHERRRLAAERGELVQPHAAGAGCPWCGFPIPPQR